MWISVEDRLPEINTHVLVFLSNKGFQGVPYIVTEFNRHGFDVSNVTHWQPLPKPPKESKQTKKCQHTVDWVEDWVNSLGEGVE